MTIADLQEEEQCRDKRPHLELIEPSLTLLPAYTAALEGGWSPDNVKDVSREELETIRTSPSAFIADHLTQAGTVKLPDGSENPKLPKRARRMWDGDRAALAARHRCPARPCPSPHPWCPGSAAAGTPPRPCA